MSTLDKKEKRSTKVNHQVNAHGTEVRCTTTYAPDKVTEVFTQQCENKWVPFKRVVHAVH